MEVSKQINRARKEKKKRRENADAVAKWIGVNLLNLLNCPPPPPKKKKIKIPRWPGAEDQAFTKGHKMS